MNFRVKDLGDILGRILRDAEPYLLCVTTHPVVFPRQEIGMREAALLIVLSLSDG